MAWYDTVIDFVGKYGEDIVNVGTSVYDIYNQQQVKGQAQEAMRPGGITDPFGAERPQYQGMLSSLMQDPSYIQNLPGYQFQQQMGEQAINRNAAKMGKYFAPNKLYEISKFNQGLAETSYGAEASRLANLAGANIAPNAGVYDTMLGGVAKAGTAQGIAGGRAAGSIFDLLKTFSGGSGGSTTGGTGIGGLATGALGMINNEFDLGMGEYTGLAGEAIGGLIEGKDPKQVALDAAQSYGKDFLKDKALDYAKKFLGGGADTAGTSFLPGGDAGADSLYGDLPGPGFTGTPTTPGGLGQLGQQYAEAKQAFSGGTKLTSIGGAAGGFIGGMLGSKLDKDTPLGGYVGSVLGSAGGAAATAAVTGSAIGGAAMAAGGPAAIAGALLIIGQGIAGMFKGAKARDKSQDAFRAAAGSKMTTLMDDPTGQGLGQGWEFSDKGYDFFMPKKYYASLYNKLTQGEYLGYGATADVQGQFGFVKNTQTGEWEGGRWGQDAETAFTASGFQAFAEGEDIASIQTKYMKGVQQTASEKQYASAVSSFQTGGGEGGGNVTGAVSNQLAAQAGLGQQYKQVTSGGGEAGEQTTWQPVAGSLAARQADRAEQRALDAP